MKKLSLSIIALSCIVMSLTGCPSPSTSPTSTPNPSTSVNPSVAPSATTGTGHFASKSAFIEYLKCIKTKVPALTPAIDVHISNINGLNDAQWLQAIPMYEAATKAYAAYGC